MISEPFFAVRNDHFALIEPDTVIPLLRKYIYFNRNVVRLSDFVAAFLGGILQCTTRINTSNGCQPARN